MPSELEQYLFDHQFDFEVGSYDAERGCHDCGESDSTYGLSSSYGRTIPGHSADCDLAKMLAHAGFDVAMRADPQGCPTPEQWATREHTAEIVRAALANGANQMQAQFAVVIDRYKIQLRENTALGEFMRINAVADLSFATYHSNDVPSQYPGSGSQLTI